MNKSWRTTLGGALSALGKTLIGVGILPQLSGIPRMGLTYIALTGFILDGIGDFFSKLFAADASQVKENSEQIKTVQAQMLQVPAAVDNQDTTVLRSSIARSNQENKDTK